MLVNSCQFQLYSSYTTFKYSDLSITPSTTHEGDNVTVTVTVTNTGQMDGDEVSQTSHVCTVCVCV